MAYTVANVAARVQVALGDPLGDYWNIATPSSPGYLLPWINTANRSLSRAFRTNNVRFSRQRVVVTPFTAGLVTLDRTSPQPLPADFLQPLEIWEKNVGAPDTDYTLLDFTQDQLPDIVQGTSLTVFDWVANQLKFVGATLDRTLRIDYMRGVPDFTASSDPIVFDDALDPLAYVAAGEAAVSIGQTQLGSVLLEKGAQMIDGLVAAEIFTMQRIPRRRSAPNVAPRYTAP